MKKEITSSNVKELELVEKSKSEKIIEAFSPKMQELSGFDADINEVIEESKTGITELTTARAKRLRLDIAKIRVETVKLKDKQKESIKLEDRAIMGIHNFIVLAVSEKEKALKEIELHFENEEKKRLEILQNKRVELLSEYVEDAQDRDLTKFEEDEFQALLSMKKKIHEDKILAEKKAEAERIESEKAAEAERVRIAEENKKLKAEAENARKRADADRLKRERIEAKKEVERLEVARIEAVAKSIEAEKQAKIQTELRKKADAEKAAREKLESDLRKKEEAEKKSEADRLAKIELEKQAELNKGDSEKVVDLMNDLESLKSKYEFKSKKNVNMYADVIVLIDKVLYYVGGRK